MNDKVKKKKIRGIIIAVLILSLSVVTGIKKYLNSNLNNNIVFYETVENENISKKSNNSDKIDSESNLLMNNNESEALKEDLELSNIKEDEDASNDVSNKININTASSEELQTLYRIGPATANKIIEYRKTYGDFVSIEEIKEVKGIGDAIYQKIKDNITIK